MRSLKFISAVLPLHLLAVSAVKDDDYDKTVITTITRTRTVCPILAFETCEPEIQRPWLDWVNTDNVKPTATTSKTTSTSTSTKSGSVTTSTSTRSGSTSTSTGSTTSHGGSTTTTSRHGDGATTTSSGVTTSTTSGSNDGSTTTTTSHDGTSSTTTTSGSGDGTTSTTSSGSHDGTTTTTTSHEGEGSSTTTTSHDSTITTTTSGYSNGTTTTSMTTTTTTSGAHNTTVPCPTAPGYFCPTKSMGDHCNSAGNRKQFCGKSIDDDTHHAFHTGETREYTLVLTHGVIDADGAGSRPVYFINGKTPGEAIEANWGDMVVVHVDNRLGDNITTIHWHGIRQVGTNDQDGVPGVTECGIAPGSIRTYKFHASSYGTGWYHSHALAQYGGGLRGPLIIHGPATSDYDVDMGPVMIDEKLEKGVFDLAAGIARSQAPLPAAHNVLFNGINRSPSNSTGTAAKWVVQSGKKYLFRIINSSAQSAYALRFDSHNMTVISADFVSVKPYQTEWLWISSGQRYNVIIEASQPVGAYYFRAVSQTACGGRSLNDGKGSANAVIEYEEAIGVEPFYGGNLTATFNVATDCKDEPLDKLIPHVPKSAGNFADFSNKVKLLPGGSAAAETFSTGNAIRWYLGPPTDLSSNSNTTRSNKAINVTFEQPTLKTLATVQELNYSSPIFSNTVSLETPENDWVYFVIQNNFQTAHPMHLHGHDFSVLGAGQGVFDINTHGGQLRFNNPIRRDTTNLFGMPVPNSGNPPRYVSGWTVIGFQTDNPGAWIMHCHVMWHADGGMGIQYLERPGSIKADSYYNTDFKQQCSNVEAYHAGGGKHKAPYEAGLKRHMAEHAYGYHHGHVARDFRSY